MTKTLLFGGSGFFGPVILSKDPNIISVGRTKPPSYCQNKHIQINDLDELNKLDSIEFDKVIFATHADDTMKLIENPSGLEKAILTKCKYETNQIIVHQDYKLMPANKKVWSSWNVLNHKHNNNNSICVTYWINKLQRIKSDKPILVTLNPQLNRLPSKQEIIKKLSFRHPVLDKNYLKAQNEINSIQYLYETFYNDPVFI